MFERFAEPSGTPMLDQIRKLIGKQPKDKQLIAVGPRQHDQLWLELGAKHPYHCFETPEVIVDGVLVVEDKNQSTPVWK